MSKSPTIIPKRVPLGPARVKPGEILEQEFIIPRGLTQSMLADKMGVDRMRINEIVRGKRAITADTALRLAGIFGTTPQFWLGLQNDHDLAVAAQSHPETIKMKVPAYVLDPRTPNEEAYIPIDEIEPGSELAEAVIRNEAQFSKDFVARRSKERKAELERLRLLSVYLRVEPPKERK